MSQNPLKQFFRQPALYINLPSGGRYWADSALTMTPNLELPVYPMTAVDEITYRTPDAVFGGQATVQVIQSCMPNIHNAWAMPSVDLNSILIGIRIASYGHEMDVSSVCPSCQHQGDYTADLRVSLQQIGCAAYHEGKSWGELQFEFRPLNYQEQNQINLAQYEQQRQILNIQDSDLEETEKMRLLSECLTAVTALTVDSMARCTVCIRTGSAIVTDFDHIKEFYAEAERKLFQEIRDYVIGLREPSEMPMMTVQCDQCSHEYKQGLILDQVSFFGNAS